MTKDDMGASQATGLSQQAAEPVVSALTGFDPSRDGFDHARLMMVVGRLLRMVAEKNAELTYGAWNADYCASDAAHEALQFFRELGQEIDWFADQAAEAKKRPRSQQQSEDNH